MLGLVIGTALGWGNLPTIALAIALAFLFGYSFTVCRCCGQVWRSRLSFRSRWPRTRFSITVMEIVDNAVVLVIPGAMEAGLADPLFWGSLGFALAVAWVVAFPVNRWLIARGRGHAVVHCPPRALTATLSSAYRVSISGGNAPRRPGASASASA